MSKLNINEVIGKRISEGNIQNEYVNSEGDHVCAEIIGFNIQSINKISVINSIYPYDERFGHFNPNFVEYVGEDYIIIESNNWGSLKYVFDNEGNFVGFESDTIKKEGDEIHTYLNSTKLGETEYIDQVNIISKEYPLIQSHIDGRFKTPEEGSLENDSPEGRNKNYVQKILSNVGDKYIELIDAPFLIDGEEEYTLRKIFKNITDKIPLIDSQAKENDNIVPQKTLMEKVNEWSSRYIDCEGNVVRSDVKGFNLKENAGELITGDGYIIARSGAEFYLLDKNQKPLTRGTHGLCLEGDKIITTSGFDEGERYVKDLVPLADSLGEMVDIDIEDYRSNLRFSETVRKNS